MALRLRILLEARDAVRGGVAALRRAALWPLAVRLLVLGTGTLAYALVLPPALYGAGAWLPVGVLSFLPALVPTFGPKSRFVLPFELVAVVIWILRGSAVAEHISWATLILLAAALYVHHAGCALAAVLPFDVRPYPDVLVRWAARTGTVVGATVVLGVLVWLVSLARGTAAPAVVPVVGLLAAAALAGVGAYLLRRPTRG